MVTFKTQKNDVAKTIVMVLLLVVLVILSVLVTRGVGFKDENFSNIEFWIAIGLDMAFVILVFNIVRGTHTDNIKQNPKGAYFCSFSRFAKCVLHIKQNKLYKNLNLAVASYNEELKEQAYDKALFKITDKITYSDIAQYDVELNEYGLEKKELKRFAKLQKKYLAGTLRYAKMKARYITHDKVILPSIWAKNDMRSSTGKVKAFVNALVIVTFFVTNVVLKSITFTYNDEGIWYVILEQSFMFLSALWSAFRYTRMIIDEMIANLTQKADWCQRYGFEPQGE